MATYRTKAAFVLPGPGTQVVPPGTLIGDGTDYPLPEDFGKGLKKGPDGKLFGSLEEVSTPKPLPRAKEKELLPENATKEEGDKVLGKKGEDK